MGTGYIRQSSAGIVDGFIVEAADINAEYNRLEAAFNGTTGHAHDGTTGNGPQIDLTTSVTGILPDSHLPGTITDPREFDDLVTFNAGAEFPNATSSSNGITLNTGISQTQIASSGIFARNGGQIYLRPRGATDSTNEATLSTSGVFTATSFAGAGSGITAINASNIASGTLGTARLSGSYTGIVGTGALNAGSITSGFGNINIGTSTFTGNGSGLSTLNASNLSSGTIPNGRFPATLPAASGTNLTNLNASNLSSGTVPSARISGSYTGITGTGTLNAGSITSGFGSINIGTSTFTGNGSGLSSLNASNLSSGTVPSARVSGAYTGITSVGNLSADLNVLKSTARIGVGTSGGVNGGLANVTNYPTGSITLFAESGIVYLRPNGATTTTNQATLATNGTFSATTFSGSGASLTSLPAGQLTGTVASARISGSYTGITGTGALNAGSISSGFGNINIGTSTFTGNGSGLTSLNASNLSSGTIPGARFPSTLPTASGTNLTNLNASRLSSGTVPSARISGSYTGITGVGTVTSGVWNAGNVTSSSAVRANGGTFLGSGSLVYLAPNSGSAITSGTTILLRPRGSGTQVSQTTIEAANGNMSVAGSVTSGGSVTAETLNITSNTQDMGVIGRSTSNPWSFQWNGSSGTIYVGGVTNGNFVISTSPDPSSNRCFYVDSTQTITYGTFAPQGNIQPVNTVIYTQNKGTSTLPMFIYQRSNTSSGAVIDIYNNTAGNPPGGTQIGSITTTASATQYNTSSDERMKDFIGEYDPETAISIIRADPVRDFTWKNTGAYAVGWGAQTSYAVSPDLATPPVDEDGIWGIDQGKRTPYLWAAMSRVLDRLDELEARVAELEAKYEN